MSLNNGFIDAVNERRYREVYQRLADILPIDPSLKKQDEMLMFAQERLPDLFKPHNGESLSFDEQEWTDAYYKEQKRALEKNFSRERLDLMRKMTKHRYADIIEYREEENSYQQKIKKPGSATTVGGAATVVGALAAVIGVAVSSTALTVAGTVVAVGGVTAIAFDKIKK